MADSLHFDLVSPERLLVSTEASGVLIPGSEGDFQALPDHAPVVTTLRPGIVTVAAPKGEEKYLVTGGFAEVTAERASVLAEHAVPVADVTQEMIDEFSAAAKAEHEAAKPEIKDELAKQIGDMEAVAAELGLAAR